MWIHLAPYIDRPQPKLAQTRAKCFSSSLIQKYWPLQPLPLCQVAWSGWTDSIWALIWHRRWAWDGTSCKGRDGPPQSATLSCTRWTWRVWLTRRTHTWPGCALFQGHGFTVIRFFSGVCFFLSVRIFSCFCKGTFGVFFGFFFFKEFLWQRFGVCFSRIRFFRFVRWFSFSYEIRISVDFFVRFFVWFSIQKGWSERVVSGANRRVKQLGKNGLSRQFISV